MMERVPKKHEQHVVLVVDDEVQIRDSFRDLLKRDGYQVLTARDGEQGLEIVGAFLPCLIISDIMMPKMDGLTFCQKIKENPNTKHIPFIFVTAKVTESDLDRGISLGAVDYIKKPFDRGEVSMRIRNQIRLHESLQYLTAAEGQLRAVSEAAMDAIVLMDGQGRIAEWNKAAAALFGYTAEEALSRDVHDLIVPEKYSDAFRKAVPRFFETGQWNAIGRIIELEAVRKDGREIPVELSLSAVFLDDQWQAVAIIRDVSERKGADRKIRESEERYRTLVETTREGIAALDVETGAFRFTNSALQEMMCYSQEEISAMKFSDLTLPDELEEMNTEFGAHVRGEKSVASNIHFRKKDGSILVADIRTTPMILGGDDVIVGFFHDVTEQRELRQQVEAQEAMQKQMEVELRHAQKLEAVGQLASGIAHEINTPAQYVGDNTRFLKESVEELFAILQKYDELKASVERGEVARDLLDALNDAIEDVDVEYLRDEIPQAIDQSLEGIGQVSRIVRSMKEFAHTDSGDKKPADINHAIENTLTISRNEYKYVADVEKDFGELPLVLCHVNDLNQVFLNLLVNAGHAIEDVVKQSGEKGKISIRTSVDGGDVKIEFADTGTGIPEEIRARIFDPFFTTKEVGRGSGQGLAISRAVVVERHQGKLEVETEEGKGTKFTITLPVEGSEDDEE